MAPDQPPEPIEVALAVAAVPDRLGIPDLVGGSMASSLYGEPRSTNDADFVIDLRAGELSRLAAALHQEFSVPEGALHEAVRDHTSFNALHRPTGVNVDLFVDIPQYSVLRDSRPPGPRSLRPTSASVVAESCVVEWSERVTATDAHRHDKS